MYYLINNSDQSYNCSSEEPFPSFMLSDDVTEISSDYGMAGFTDITSTFYDVTTDTFSESSDYILMTDEEVFNAAQIEEEQRALNQELAKAESFNTMVDKLALVLTSEQTSSLYVTNAVSTDELTLIEEALNETP
tara:strand:+ start:570 stop:974 length:405 start_codon:yes stop_codon:yes gene_type:complete